MNSFSATTETDAVVAAPRDEIWAALTDPVLLPKLTPLLRRIDAKGDLWTWHMMQIKGLGIGIAPCFTEKMTITEGRSIEYHHAPPEGVHERSGAEGWYRLEDVEGGTHLAIKLTLTVELPLPRTAGPAVRRIMSTTMARTGERFSANLLKHLGVSESTRSS